jgi:hypothetical protein
MIRGKIKYFDMDYFGSHQMIAELDTGDTIHAYHNGNADVIDIYKGNEISHHRVIPDSKSEYVHLCRGYLKIKFRVLIPEKNHYEYLLATIPYDVGKTCTVI